LLDKEEEAKAHVKELLKADPKFCIKSFTRISLPGPANYYLG